MIASPPVTSDADLCDKCSKVLPARSPRHCTRARALVLLERGYCLHDPEPPGGLAALSPETQALYQPLVELSDVPETMLEPVSFDDGPEAALTTVDLVPVDETEDVWAAAPETALAIREDPAPIRQRRRGRGRRKKGVKMVELRPVTDPASSTIIWTHPEDPPAAEPPSVPVIDGGGLITAPQPLPKPIRKIQQQVKVVRRKLRTED